MLLEINCSCIFLVSTTIAKVYAVKRDSRENQLGSVDKNRFVHFELNPRHRSIRTSGHAKMESFGIEAHNGKGESESESNMIRPE